MKLRHVKEEKIKARIFALIMLDEVPVHITAIESRDCGIVETRDNCCRIRRLVCDGDNSNISVAGKFGHVLDFMLCFCLLSDYSRFEQNSSNKTVN